LSEILSLDPGGHFGWARRCAGSLSWGTVAFDWRNKEAQFYRLVRYRDWLGGMLTCNTSLVVYEKQLMYSSDILYGYTSITEELCARVGIQTCAANITKVKAWSIPKVKLPPLPRRQAGDPPRKPRSTDRGKERMTEEAMRRLAEMGYTCAGLDEHQADAIMILLWAEARVLGVR
jgi:hypothetical protein